MGFISKLLGQPGNNGIKRFRGQGYTDEGALHHADQRMTAWVREVEQSGKRMMVFDKNISYSKKSQLMVTCSITCSYKMA